MAKMIVFGQFLVYQRGCKGVHFGVSFDFLGSAYAEAILGSEEHAKMIDYLINKGANVNSVTNAGNTALIFAAR